MKTRNPSAKPLPGAAPASTRSPLGSTSPLAVFFEGALSGAPLDAVARRSGIRYDALSMYRRGTRVPSSVEVAKIAAALDATPAEVWARIERAVATRIRVDRDGTAVPGGIPAEAPRHRGQPRRYVGAPRPRRRGSKKAAAKT